MRHSIPGWCVLVTVALSWSCSSESASKKDASEDDPSCVAGRSIECTAPSGCSGVQVCKPDGSGYGACVCGGSGTGGSGVANTGGSGVASTGGSNVARGGQSGSSVGPATGGLASTGGRSGSGGTTATSLGGAGSTVRGGSGSGLGGGSRGGAGSALGGTTGSASAGTTCAPRDMTGYAPPSYKPARKLGGSCSAEDLESYYTDCYSSGNCSAFAGGGALAACGACLSPSELEASEYGPLLQMGSGSSVLYQTNTAGCIELVGEPTCAPKMQAATLCEYSACADNCPIADTASFDRQYQCMLNARSTVCTALESAAVCITDSAHITACTGSGFKGAFLAVARVFCVESH